MATTVAAVVTPPVLVVGLAGVTLRAIGFAFVQMPIEQTRDAIYFLRRKKKGRAQPEQEDTLPQQDADPTAPSHPESEA